MTNFNTRNKTPMEILVTEDSSHFERDFIHITTAYLWSQKDVPLLSNFSELFSKKIELSQNYFHSLVVIFILLTTQNQQ